MPISQYQQSIINARAIPLKKTREAEERTDTALRVLFSRLEGLLNDSTRGDSVQRSLWRRKQAELANLINTVALDLKREMVTATTETADEIAQLRERETNDLLAENQFSTIVDFSAVPTQTLDLLAQRQDVEGLKVSANIWSDNQIEAINREVNVAIAGGDRQDTLVRLRAFVLGAEGFTAKELADLRRIRGTGRRRLGQSINAKAKRLLRTEIANAAWEAGRLSADQSPLVGGIKWNLSARHPHWDVCDVLATQDLYGLGKGVYPPGAIPPRPHPNDMCFMTDEIRPVEEWDEPKDVPELQFDPQDLDAADLNGQGTDHFIETQRQLAADLLQSVAGPDLRRGRPLSVEFADILVGAIDNKEALAQHLDGVVDSLLQRLKDATAPIIFVDNDDWNADFVNTLVRQSTGRDKRVTDDFLENTAGYASRKQFASGSGPSHIVVRGRVPADLTRSYVTKNLFSLPSNQQWGLVGQATRDQAFREGRSDSFMTMLDRQDTIYHELGHSMDSLIKQRNDQERADISEAVSNAAFGGRTSFEFIEDRTNEIGAGPAMVEANEILLGLDDEANRQIDALPTTKWLKSAHRKRKFEDRLSDYQRVEHEGPSEALTAYVFAHDDLKKNAREDWQLIEDAQKILGVTFTPHKEP